MEMIEVSLSLPAPLLRAARDVALQRDITLGQLLREGLQAEIRRAPRPAKSPDRAEERRLAMIRARFADDFAYASDWSDLQTRLRRRGAVLREAGGGLALVTAQGGGRICKASDVGMSLSRLARRFRAPFPGDRAGFPWAHTVCTDETETTVVEPWQPEPSGQSPDG